MSYDKRKVIDLAISQIGYHEKDSNSQLDDPNANSGDGNWTKYARDLDKLSGFYNGRKNGFSWCDVFVDWCFVTAYGRTAAQYLLCQPDYSAGAGCSYSAQYFKEKGRFCTCDPQPGDQIFFGDSWNDVWHTGLVVEVTDRYVVAVEGNSADMVAKRTYTRNDNRIFGYGRPRWESEEIDADTGNQTQEKPTSSQSGRTCTAKLPELKRGDKGEAVRAAQDLLALRGFRCGPSGTDGDFGAKTLDAVKAFQRSRQLDPDGEIGHMTWETLIES